MGREKIPIVLDHNHRNSLPHLATHLFQNTSKVRESRQFLYYLLAHSVMADHHRHREPPCDISPNWILCQTLY